MLSVIPEFGGKNIDSILVEGAETFLRAKTEADIEEASQSQYEKMGSYMAYTKTVLRIVALATSEEMSSVCSTYGYDPLPETQQPRNYQGPAQGMIQQNY